MLCQALSFSPGQNDLTEPPFLVTSPSGSRKGKAGRPRAPLGISTERTARAWEAFFLGESLALVFPTQAEVDNKPEALYFLPEQPASPEQICREGLLVLPYVLSLSYVASGFL